jgi:carboxymethylenebutenolidase
MKREISDLYDEYLHTPMGRRNFMQRLTILAGGVTAASAALTMLEGTTAQAAQVAEDDPNIQTGMITYPGATGEIKAYMARPAGAEKLPAVIVIHANRGLWPHFKDIARKLALDGYLAIAPDMLSPAGGTPEHGESRSAEGDAALETLSKIPTADVENNLVAAVDFLKSHPESTGKVGAIGFCWGGGNALSLAVNSARLDASVAYYGSQPQDGFAKINAPMLLHYAADDPRLVQGIPPFVAKMEEHGKPYELYIYPGTRHAFNQDNRPDRYDVEAAYLSWTRTLDFFGTHLA